ncbi:MAG: ribonuclease HII [bacterium]|nr:ribonuclease HII [bacterium]
MRYVIGIDEAGRGPIAGPVAVGAVLAPEGFLVEHEYFKKGIRDSKQLSVAKREALFAWLQREKQLKHVVSLVGPRVVDREGISVAVHIAIQRALRRLVPEHERAHVLVLLDGGLRAPRTYANQATIIRGDEKEPLIALASVAAKVTRDDKMRALSYWHPEYGFDGHKGYGTPAHYRAIKTHGMIDSHRRSFLKTLLEQHT